MATIQQEIMSIAEAQGYEGKSSGTIAEAVNALGSVMGGGGSGGGGAIATFPLAMDNMSATAGEFLSGEYAGETATNEKIYELAAKGVMVVAVQTNIDPDYGSSYTFCNLQTAQKSGSYYIVFVSVSLTGSGTPTNMTVGVTRYTCTSGNANNVSYTIASKPIQ